MGTAVNQLTLTNTTNTDNTCFLYGPGIFLSSAHQCILGLCSRLFYLETAIQRMLSLSAYMSYNDSVGLSLHTSCSLPVLSGDHAALCIRICVYTVQNDRTKHACTVRHNLLYYWYLCSIFNCLLRCRLCQRGSSQQAKGSLVAEVACRSLLRSSPTSKPLPRPCSYLVLEVCTI